VGAVGGQGLAHDGAQLRQVGVQEQRANFGDLFLREAPDLLIRLRQSVSPMGVT
jgi:hypothetical protein